MTSREKKKRHLKSNSKQFRIKLLLIGEFEQKNKMQYELYF